MADGAEAAASRCGVIRTSAVDRRKVLLLLRLRYLLEQGRGQPLLCEEVAVTGLAGLPHDRLDFLTEEEARRLLLVAEPDAPVTPDERKETLREVLAWWDDILPRLKAHCEDRAQRILDAHRRVRAAAGLGSRGLSVRPQFPPDLLGLLVLLPVPRGVVS